MFGTAGRAVGDQLVHLPIAQSLAGVEGLAEKYDKRLNVVVVYVIKAHPVGSVSPYKGVEGSRGKPARRHFAASAQNAGRPARFGQRV